MVQFCLDGTKELVKKCIKETFYRNYIGFGVNIAGKYLEIHGLIMEKEIKYYLGLDIGIGSVGWGIIGEDKNGEH